MSKRYQRLAGSTGFFVYDESLEDVLSEEEILRLLNSASAHAATLNAQAGVVEALPDVDPNACADSRDYDIEDAYVRGWNAALAAVKGVGS